MSVVPVFILVRDRLSALQKTIASIYKTPHSGQQYVDTRIILIDNGSTYPPMLEYLENSKNLVLKNGKVCYDIQEFITEYTKSSDWYVVTDPDIELCLSVTLAMLIRVMRCNPGIPCAGPHLKLDDLPKNRYTDEQIYLQNLQFGDKEKKVLHGINVIEAPIHTTFSVHRADRPFAFFRPGTVRALDPYDARHLGWYLDVENIPADEMWYLEHANPKFSTMKKHLQQHEYIK